MTSSFFAAQFIASRADALIGQIQAGLGQAGLQADTALVLADEACGQALIDRVVQWLRQELSSQAVCALPVMGRQGPDACIQVLLGHTGADAFGPIHDWSFDALVANMGSVDPGRQPAAAQFVAMDPRTPFFAQRLNWMHEAGQAHLLGAMGAPSGAYAGPTGLRLPPQTPLIWQTFPGAQRLPQDWTITAAEGQIIHEIDGRPALDVLREVAGQILSRKLDQVPNYLFAAFPVSSADPEDFLLRRINGLGQRSGAFSIEDEVLPGMPLAFARRNGPHVSQALAAGIESLTARAGAPPRAAVFLSDLRRASDFSAERSELAQVREHLGDIPLVAGQVQGLIDHNRLYTLASQLIFIL